MLANYGNVGGGSVEITILQEAEDFSHFIVDNSNGEKKAYIFGDEEFLHKAYTPIKYLVGRSNIKLSLAKKSSSLPGRYFHILRTNVMNKFITDTNANVLRYKTYGKFTMLLVQNGQPAER